MKINIVYKEEKGWFVGHIQEYPDYESQGKTLEELRGNLIEIYNDIHKGLVPDAEPFQILEVAIWKEKNWLKLLNQTVVFSCVMVAILIGIEILKPVKVSLFQDTQKLKKASQKESLKDYRKDVSNNAAAQGSLVPRGLWAAALSEPAIPAIYMKFPGVHKCFDIIFISLLPSIALIQLEVFWPATFSDASRGIQDELDTQDTIPIIIYLNR